MRGKNVEKMSIALQIAAIASKTCSLRVLNYIGYCLFKEEYWISPSLRLEEALWLSVFFISERGKEVQIVNNV